MQKSLANVSATPSSTIPTADTCPAVYEPRGGTDKGYGRVVDGTAVLYSQAWFVPSGPEVEHCDEIDRYAADRTVKRLARRAGIAKRISPHSLRHSFITAAFDARVPLRDVQEAATCRAGSGVALRNVE